MISVYRSGSSWENDLFSIKSGACPHCQLRGTLVGHGNLKGYSGRGTPDQVRGKRLLCNNRRRNKPGCGGTFSILQTEKIRRHMVSTLLVWTFLLLFTGGLPLRRAWLEAMDQTRARFCDSTGYKVLSRFRNRQTALRTQLCQRVVPPEDRFIRNWPGRDPSLLQLLEHLRLAFADSPDPICAFQHHFQMSFL